MQIVGERTIVPRPVQRPSDIERRPIDFGIESPPPAPPKPEATIVKSAITADFELIQESIEIDFQSVPPKPDVIEVPSEEPNGEEDWGEGIL